MRDLSRDECNLCCATDTWCNFNWMAIKSNDGQKKRVLLIYENPRAETILLSHFPKRLRTQFKCIYQNTTSCVALRCGPIKPVSINCRLPSHFPSLFDVLSKLLFFPPRNAIALRHRIESKHEKRENRKSHFWWRRKLNFINNSLLRLLMPQHGNIGTKARTH